MEAARFVNTPLIDNPDYTFDVVADFHVGINKLFVDVGEECSVWRQRKEYGTTAEKWLVIVIEIEVIN